MRLVVLVLVVLPLVGCGERLVAPSIEPARVLEIERRIAALRGLPFDPPARVEVLDPTQMSATVTRLRESDDSLRILRVWSQIDGAFGDPWKVTPLEAARRLPTDNSYGVYSAADDTLFLSRGRLNPLPDFVGDRRQLVEIVVTHELTHAWQHRHFPELFEPTSDVDWFAARHALLEGDAEVTTLALIEGDTDDRALEKYLRFRREMADAAGQHPDRNRDWRLRYDEALRHLVGVVRRRGWDGLNGLLAHPPRATVAILERAGAGCEGERDEPLPCPDGWRLAVATAVGAFNIPSLLQLRPAPLAMKGWCGDWLQICRRNDSHDFAWRWQSIWRTEDEAESFAAEVRRRLGRQHERASEADPVSPSPASWIERRGRRVAAADSNVAGAVIPLPANW